METVNDKNNGHISIDDIRAIPGKENLSEEQAQEIIDFICIYCHISYSLYAQKEAEKLGFESEGKIIKLASNPPDENSDKAA